MKIGFILKELRSLKGVSQRKIAEMLNVERSTYAKWETDENTVNVNRLKDIADVYGLHFHYLGICIEEQKIINKNDVAKWIKIAEAKARDRENGTSASTKQ